MEYTLFLSPQRCIGCRACVAACRECDSHRGLAMVFIDFLDREQSFATHPTTCMHCEDPVAPCAQVCPTQAILIDGDGVVHQANKERCIACRNCVYACPFGVPKIEVVQQQQYKCNMCYDRVVEGQKPMCATVCPSEAITYSTYADVAASGRLGKPVNVFQFGTQTVRTAVYVMAPPDVSVVPVLPPESQRRPAERSGEDQP